MRQFSEIVLASASPRRKQLLEEAGVSFRVQVSDADETLDAEVLAHPEQACIQLAERKASAVVDDLVEQGVCGKVAVIGSDTMVVLDNRIFGKPEDEQDARAMLRELSDRAHQVITAVSVWEIERENGVDAAVSHRSFADITLVRFLDLTEQRITEYLATGESFDKAGAYGIQGYGGALVEGIEGSMDTVIGLPAKRLLEEFPELR